jgi:L-aminopeptidase/D-esterase-like protein
LLQGNVGAGTGATVGKLGGPGGALKSGLGSASARLPLGERGTITVGAVVAVNAVGDIHDPTTGAIIAGARAPSGGWLDAFAAFRSGIPPATALAPDAAGTNTTVALVATDAPLDGSTAYRLAQNAHDALARTIWPCHTPFDGDTIFALSTAPGPLDSRSLAVLSVAAEDVLSRAVVRAVQRAIGSGGLPAAAEWLAAPATGGANRS